MSFSKLFNNGELIFFLEIVIIFILITSCGHKSERQSPSENKYRTNPLVKGMIGYKIPDTMKVDNSYRAVVTIAKTLEDSILYMGIDRSGFTEEAIKISSIVNVRLKDPTNNKNFEIHALSTEEQPVLDSSNTVWQWNIIPIRGGENDLIIQVTAEEKDLPLFEKTVKVKASFTRKVGNFAEDNWQWLSSAIIIPLFLWAVKKFSRRKKTGKRNK